MGVALINTPAVAFFFFFFPVWLVLAYCIGKESYNLVVVLLVVVVVVVAENKLSWS